MRSTFYLLQSAKPKSLILPHLLHDRISISTGLQATCHEPPVVTIMPFHTEEEVLTYANSTQYGLASTVWTQDLTKAHRVASKIESGIVWINCWLVRDLRTPFGGVKQSGVGREGGFEALHFFTEPQNICVNLD